MSFVTLANAKIHLRATDGTDEDDLIGACITAAEQTAASIVDRAIYADSTALNAAVAAAPAALTTATATYTTAMTAAQALTDSTEQAAAIKTAENAYTRAQIAYRQVVDGMVANESVKAAVLLIVGHLYANREDVVAGVSVAQLPNGAEWLLQPYKVYA
jgi:exosome complex RNA-binding protein Rrp42 (RNase PH superfamily)